MPLFYDYVSEYNKGRNIDWCVLVVCSFTYRSSASVNGTFTTPNYPGLYPRETQCHYLFYGNDRQRVHIRFIFFDVEGVSPG